MTLPAADWRLDRLSASARETAEHASLAAGLSLSAWLTRVITEATTAEQPAEQPAEAATPLRRTSSTIVEFMRESHSSGASAAAKAWPDSKPTAVVESLAAHQSALEGATMLPVATMAPAGLGARQGDDVPESLLADLTKRGVRQPLLVRRAATDERYEIICGHRRWRAAQRIGLARVPTTLATHDEAQALLVSLKENMAQGDLSAIDEANTYLRLLTRHAVETSAIAEASGHDRQHVVRAMRLLGLPAPVREMIRSGSLSAEHAYLLLDSPNPEGFAETIRDQKLSAVEARQRLLSLPGYEARL
jgi:ParB/RepB/Spo0J family partition protein